MYYYYTHNTLISHERQLHFGEEISKEEYDNLLSIVKSGAPDAPEGYRYYLTRDGQWELEEAEITHEDEQAE